MAIDDEEDLDARLSALKAVFDGPAPVVVYTYYAGLDYAGHVSGVDSDAWRAELDYVDRLVRAIHDGMPRGSRLILTGDHGTVDLLPEDEGRIDLAKRPDLARGVRLMAGDPRMRYLFVEEDPERVAARWGDALEGRGVVLTRREAIELGLFGPVVRPEVEPRMGDLLVIAGDHGIGIFDSRVAPWEVPLVGHHGAVTDDELIVPLFVWDL